MRTENLIVYSSLFSAWPSVLHIGGTQRFEEQMNKQMVKMLWEEWKSIWTETQNKEKTGCVKLQPKRHHGNDSTSNAFTLMCRCTQGNADCILTPYSLNTV